jgi:hypothetical protein
LGFSQKFGWIGSFLGFAENAQPIGEFVSNPKLRRLYGLVEKWHDSAIPISAVLPATFPAPSRSLKSGLSKDFQRKNPFGRL